MAYRKKFKKGRKFKKGKKFKRRSGTRPVRIGYRM